MSDTQFPTDHPLHGKNPEGHAEHLLTYSEVLEDAAASVDAGNDDVEGAMLVLTGQGGTETLPTVSENVDSRWASLWMLGAHIHHVMAAGMESGDGTLTMEEVAQHAIDYIREHQGPQETYD